MKRWFPKDQTYLLTRRCLGGQFRLVPNADSRASFLYNLALAAERFDIDIHCLCVMSNHYHVVVGFHKLTSDLPAFMHCLNLNTALVFNARQNRHGTFWEAGSYHMEALTTQESVLRAMVYVICNPVSAGLVRNPYTWPGFNTRAEHAIDYRCLTHRPNFFGPLSTKPETVWLKFSKPAGFDDYTDQTFRQTLMRMVQERLEEIWSSREAQGLGYLGAAAVRRQTIDQAPNTEGVVATIHAQEDVDYADFRDEQERAEYRAFCEAHDECLDIVRNGGRPDFPIGTYKMVVTYGFPVVPSPD